MEISLEVQEEVVLIDSAQNTIDRIRLSVDTNSALGNIASWLCDYTMIDADTNFSFKDHEMQIDIVNDINARQVIQKCSQVGATELISRKAVGITAISKSSHIMYVMPTRTLVSKHATSRIKPIIDTSPMLTDMINKNAKGSELMGIGTSFLHFGGTTGAVTGAISIPAKFVFIDELDFCDLDVVGKYQSRLKHAEEDIHGRKGVVGKFSTPTLEDYGINLEFKKSDQKHYQCYCSGCSEWFEPEYFRDIVIPNYQDEKGAEGKLIDLTKELVVSGTLNITDAYMRCPHCLADVWEDLCDPSHRKWVARFPESIVSGWQIHPWDAPRVNSIPSTLMEMAEYDNIADYYNFAVGIPFADKNNSFLLSAFEGIKYAQWIEMKVSGNLSRFCIGCDVGRTSHITVGYKDKVGKYHVCYLERYTASVQLTLGQRLVELMKLFQSRAIVIDAMPDFSAAQHVAQKMPSRIVLACEYTKTKGKGKLSNTTVDKDKNLVSAYRTGVLSDLLKVHNSGGVLYPNGSTSMVIKSEIDEVKLNLKNLKKVKKTDNEGEDFEVFVKLGADHYGHSLSYFKIACDALGEALVTNAGQAAPMSINTFNTQGTLEKAALPVPSGGGIFR